MNVSARLNMREPLIPTKNPTELVTRLELNDALTGRNIVFEFIFDTNAARDAFFSVPANLPALSTAVLVTEGPWIQIYTRATGSYDPAGWNDISPTFITNFDVVYFTSSNVPAAPYSLRVLYVNTTTGVLAVASQDGTRLVYQTPPDIESFNALRNFPSGSTISFHGEDGGVPYLGLLVTDNPDAQEIDGAKVDTTHNALYFQMALDGLTIGATQDSGVTQYVKFPIVGDSTINGRRILTEDDLGGGGFDTTINDPAGTVITRAVQNPPDGPYIGLCATDKPDAASIGDAYDNGYRTMLHELTTDHSFMSATDTDGHSTGINVLSDHVEIYNNDSTGKRLQTVLFPVDGPSAINGKQIATLNDIPAPITTDVQSFPYSDSNWSGTVSAFEAALDATTSIVSFWGDFTELQVVPTGNATQVLSPAQYPLLARFVGQVDQFAMGYNASAGSFAYMPMRITAAQGFEIVAAPNIAVGTNFSFQFMLVLSASSVSVIQSSVDPEHDMSGGGGGGSDAVITSEDIWVQNDEPNAIPANPVPGTHWCQRDVNLHIGSMMLRLSDLEQEVVPNLEARCDALEARLAALEGTK